MGETKVVAPLDYYDMDFNHTYVFIPKKYEKKVNEALKCVAGVKEEDCKIILVNTAETSNPL